MSTTEQSPVKLCEEANDLMLNDLFEQAIEVNHYLYPCSPFKFTTNY